MAHGGDEHQSGYSGDRGRATCLRSCRAGIGTLNLVDLGPEAQDLEQMRGIQFSVFPSVVGNTVEVVWKLEKKGN